MKVALAALVGLVVVVAAVELAGRPACHPGDPGIKIGNMLVAGCP